MTRFSIIILLLLLYSCTPKGPQTFENKLVGQKKSDLIAKKGPAHQIKIFDNSEAYIYIKKEEYYGKNPKNLDTAKPKRTYQIEFIYYINDKDVIYKYQVWRKKLKK